MNRALDSLFSLKILHSILWCKKIQKETILWKNRSSEAHLRLAWASNWDPSKQASCEYITSLCINAQFLCFAHIINQLTIRDCLKAFSVFFIGKKRAQHRRNTFLCGKKYTQMLFFCSWRCCKCFFSLLWRPVSHSMEKKLHSSWKNISVMQKKPSQVLKRFKRVLCDINPHSFCCVDLLVI